MRHTHAPPPPQQLLLLLLHIFLFHLLGNHKKAEHLGHTNNTQRIEKSQTSAAASPLQGRDTQPETTNEGQGNRPTGVGVERTKRGNFFFLSMQTKTLIGSVYLSNHKRVNQMIFLFFFPSLLSPPHHFFTCQQSKRKYTKKCRFWSNNG